ncbi:nucleotidyltransferase domain-containing protein [Polynucleobacter kasalickyi]|uniref:Nucleotidyltransferase domain-containing protein n=1 Tax=Polynucleobacter kasalickyi TaxID=1938817 RepID=A0A1W2AFX7_9BURK|nr:nucleotidyltransferase domain-containing protein [Polynucleobacter kasalickyi]SMC59490.1 Nucleotidyltransferase domain-containing protein [Polynucleobacter kasalickyi]
MKVIPFIDLATQNAAHAFIKKISSQYDVSMAFLFGSRARHTHQSESDADIAILLKGSIGRFMATKFAMDDLAYDVLLETGIRIQPLPIWQEEWDHPECYSNPALLKNIRTEGIAL